jgi:hypothetical protein
MNGKHWLSHRSYSNESTHSSVSGPSGRGVSVTLIRRHQVEPPADNRRLTRLLRFQQLSINLMLLRTALLQLLSDGTRPLRPCQIEHWSLRGGLTLHRSVTCLISTKNCGPFMHLQHISDTVWAQL